LPREFNDLRLQRRLKESAMRNRPIVISRTDAARLRELLATRARAARDRDHLEELAEELERARIAEPNEVPVDVITIHTRIQVLDLISGERRELTLVLPRESDAGAGRISVLAPLGIALLGYRAGDEVEWQMPGGLRRLRIERVLQPEDQQVSAVRETYATAVG
jgi:regulator of nucleoside diphosphate kinase